MLKGKFDLIVADIDGTLIGDDKRLSPLTIATIQRVRRDFGVNVLLASARMPRAIRPFQAQLGCLDSIVALDGALVIDGPDDQRDAVVDRRLPIRASMNIVREGLNACVHVGIFRRNEWVVESIDHWVLREARGNHFSPSVGPVVERLLQWEEERSGPHKIMFRGPARRLRALRELLRQYEDQVLISSGRPTAIEIVSVTAGKWFGVKALLERFGIPSGRVIAFGDSDNDLELLQSVGHSVAPTNASGRARHVAREVTSSCVENGVAIALSKYFPELH